MSFLQPKSRKFPKDFKGRNRGYATRGNKVSFGEFGLISEELGRITSRQIEASRRAINRYIQRGGRIWIRIFPDKPISKKPLEVRQGKGKGNVEYWVAVVKPGTMLFEMSDVPSEVAYQAMKRAASKLPVKVRFVKKKFSYENV